MTHILSVVSKKHTNTKNVGRFAANLSPLAHSNFNLPARQPRAPRRKDDFQFPMPLGHGKLKVMSASLGIRHVIFASHISIYLPILLENIGILVYICVVFVYKSSFLSLLAPQAKMFSFCVSFWSVFTVKHFNLPADNLNIPSQGR